MTSGSAALQKGLYAKLLTVTALQAVIGNPPRVYDVAPNTATYPFILIGEDDEKPWSCDDWSGGEFICAVTAKGQDERGRQTVKEIIDIVRDALDEQQFSVTGHTVVLCQFDSAESLQDPDQLSWSATVRFRILLQPTT